MSNSPMGSKYFFNYMSDGMNWTMITFCDDKFFLQHCKFRTERTLELTTGGI